MSVSEPAPGGGAPLSTNQHFLCMFDKGPDQGVFGPRHIVASGWRITGAVDTAALRAALADLVVRHESLRTSIVRDVEPPYQLVHPPSTPVLTEHELTGTGDAERETAAHEFLNRIEAGRCPSTEQPLIRAALGRFDDQDSVLVLYAHHTVSDSWSLQIVIRDLAQLYAARRGVAEAELPEMAQYREYAEWQQEYLTSAPVAKARAYWREKLAGAQFASLPTDRTRTEATGVYSVHRFLIDREITSATQAVAKQLRSSPFMVLLAAFNLLTREITGADDLTVPTITSGRSNPTFAETVGPFFNFMPLRTDLSTCRTFRDLVTKTRGTCLEMYSHEVPFGEIVAEAPTVVAPFGDFTQAVQAFQCFQFPVGAEGAPVGDIEIAELRRRLLSDPDTSDIPDGVVWALDIDPEGDIVGSVRFNSNDFDAATLEGLVTRYIELLRVAVADMDAPFGTPLAA
ncbi:condensation domain-containing protein [Amycolatopsis sp. NPDC049688]|uniref:condensation domain-containing protein n=1 Tax=Amycolatopsis sp. NPDC049688 TaxID=3154733 RepID=UPI0034167203